MTTLKSLTIDEIQIGDRATVERSISRMDFDAIASGCVLEIESDAVACAAEGSDAAATETVGLSLLVSALIHRQLPGLGARIIAQDLGYAGSVCVGDRITIELKVVSKQDRVCIVHLQCLCRNQTGDVLVSGTTTVVAPAQPHPHDHMHPAEVALQRGDAFAALVNRCRDLPALTCAIVHPCDAASLLGAIAAAERGLIVPVLVGPIAKINRVAQAEGVDISGYVHEETEHSHASAVRAVALARSGAVASLMKGSIHTDELMIEVMRAECGLRTGRRMSHVFVMDVPAYPRKLLITDAAINIQPTLMQKADIIQNAIELGHALGIAEPKVAILSAVETVNPNIASTVDAAALCKMADRNQITGGILDGPLAFDNAISAEAARLKNISSPVAGQADILVVPDLEAGNMIAKQLQYLAGARSAGVVLGARVPIALTSRADSIQSRIVSAAVMLLSAQPRPTTEPVVTPVADGQPGSAA